MEECYRFKGEKTLYHCKKHIEYARDNYHHHRQNKEIEVLQLIPKSIDNILA